MVNYPDDWGIYEFDDVFRIISNNTLSRDKLTTRGNIGNVHYGDVLIKYGAVLTANDDIPKIKPEYESSAKIFLCENDIIIADTAEDETVGKAVQVGDIDIPLVAGLHTIPCRPIIPIAPRYFGYYINSKAYHNQLLPYITGIKVSSISKASIRKTLIPLPALEEQKAIADTLALFDTHITNLTELIAKKKAIRDGALEDLMSGRTRLKGFCGDWEVKTLGEIGTFTKGAPFSKADISMSGTPMILYGELYTTYKEVAYNVQKHTQRKAKAQCYSTIGDVIIPASGETAEEIARATCLMIPGIVLAGDLHIYRTDKLDGRFLSYAINHVINRQISEIAQGISIMHVNAKGLAKITVRYPTLEEQIAIADTLTALDTEITALETEREKISQIRDGAMNDLLTGKVRLLHGNRKTATEPRKTLAD